MSVGQVLKSEAVLFGGAVQAVIGLLIAFGVDVTDAQAGAIMTVAALLSAGIARAFVTPVAQADPPAPE